MSNQKNLLDLLGKIDNHLSLMGLEISSRLLDGISSDDLAAQTTQLPFPLPEEVVGLFGWHDGTRCAPDDTLEQLWLIPGYQLLSLQEALQAYAEMNAAPQWEDAWFPFLADGAGGYYVVACGDSAEGNEPVINYLSGEPEHPVEYASLTDMVRTIEAAFDRGIFFVEEGCLEMDDEAYEELAGEFNPNVDTWLPED